jgi:hypothetical protein
VSLFSKSGCFLRSPSFVGAVNLSYNNLTALFRSCFGVLTAFAAQPPDKRSKEYWVRVLRIAVCEEMRHGIRYSEVV